MINHVSMIFRPSCFSFVALLNVLCYFIAMETHLKMIVARNIQALMDEKGLTGYSLARLAKMGPTGIYDILKGNSRSPRLDTLEKVANALGVTVFELMTEVSDIDLRNRIHAKIDALPESERARAERIIDAMLAPDPQDGK